MSPLTLRLFTPKGGKLQLPTPLLTVTPFDRCPACGSERVEVTRLSLSFKCGMVQMVTDCDEFAVSSTCPYAMSAVYELRMKRIARQREGIEIPPTLMTFAPEGFAVNDKVKWVSQSAGKETVKRGIIVAVVPPDARPEAYIPEGMRKNSANGYGKSRSHTTYLVRVSGKGSMVYWPRVHYLEKIS